MTDPRTDQIAREAARLIETGRAESIDDAIRAAAKTLGCHDAPMPGSGRVRQHAQAMSMQSMGDEGYAESVRNVWEIAEQLMTVLEQGMPDAQNNKTPDSSYSLYCESVVSEDGLNRMCVIHSRHTPRGLL